MTQRDRDRDFEFGPMREDELVPYAALLDHAFGDNPTVTHDPSWQRQVGLDCFRAVRVSGSMAAGMGVLRMGQWFGGRSVPMGGVVGVVVAPEHRGGGVGSSMMRSALAEMRASGLPLSALYASTQPVYRRVGYEQAGLSVSYRAPLTALPTRERALTLRPATAADEPELVRLYTERARGGNGNLDRHAGMWGWIMREHPPVNAYLVERDGVAEGHVVHTQYSSPQQPGKALRVRDLVAATPDAGRRLLAFLADHRRVAQRMEWNGPAADPIFLQLAEQEFGVPDLQQWMVRVLDVPRALTSRGYPAGLAAELHLAVRDDVLPENDGPFVLSVADGRADVRPGGEGRVTMDVRGLAPLYSGYLPPTALRAAGLLGGPEDDLAALTAVFAGPAPWMPDHF